LVRRTEARKREKHKESRQISADSVADARDAGTPAERLEEAYQTQRERLAGEIPTQLKSASPFFFEKIVGGGSE